MFLCKIAQFHIRHRIQMDFASILSALYNIQQVCETKNYEPQTYLSNIDNGELCGFIKWLMRNHKVRKKHKKRAIFSLC